MLFDPTRHEPLRAEPWDEARARRAIAHIVSETESHYKPETWWPVHPRDHDPDNDGAKTPTPLYCGALGVFWALHYLQDVGAATLVRGYHDQVDALLTRNRDYLGDGAAAERASYLFGETPIRLWAYGARPDEDTADVLAELIAGNLDHPARELMWGSPGTMLAALFLHERTGGSRWAELFRQTAARLWSQLEWSDEFDCAYWTQDLYGTQSTYIDGVHGFVATAAPLIRGRVLMGPAAWAQWADCIANTVARTAIWEDGRVNWRAWLARTSTRPLLMQYCHGAPGFVVCLGGLPGTALDPLLLAAGEAVWAAGPLAKGNNLCHGTGGNGYAFLKLYRRTQDPIWLQRARCFAMHGIAQGEADEREYGRLRCSLWTGDPGFAIYLWNCLQAGADFPTVDTFYGSQRVA
jgi:hypothetical protein